MSNCKLCNKKFKLFFREYTNGCCKKCYLQIKNKIDSFNNQWREYKDIYYKISYDE